MRGEHGARSRVQHRHVGSSPHARGAQDGAQLVPGGNGIIPACAGSTTLSQLTATSAEDHPRMRGEHLQWYGPQSAHLGSSPHARGARSPACHRLSNARIIPACAGSTVARFAPFPHFPDHPRMRGEHLKMHRALPSGAGSSPHARGARFELARDQIVTGRWDHPRMRGEHM